MQATDTIAYAPLTLIEYRLLIHALYDTMDAVTMQSSLASENDQGYITALLRKLEDGKKQLESVQ